jgi:hypothetical protein
MILSEGPRVPFARPVQATAGFVPHSMDTGFVAYDPFPLVMMPQMARIPGGVHQPLASEPGALPPVSSGVITAAVTAAQTTAQPPSATAIKQRSMRMLPPSLIMALGILPAPRAGNVRSGLNPIAFVARGRTPGV